MIGKRDDETSEVLQFSRETVRHDWGLAKVWFLCEQKDGARKHGPRTVAADRAGL